jgi:hypothetical protein
MTKNYIVKGSKNAHTVFISYAHQDARVLNKLMTILNPIAYANEIEIWYDEGIEPGTQWYKQIEKKLKRSCVAVLLISPNFFDSSFIMKQELPMLLANSEARKCHILCLYIQHANADLIPVEVSGKKWILTDLLNSPHRPLSDLSSRQRDKFLAQVGRVIINTVTEITTS